MMAAPAGEHSQLMDRVYRHQRHFYDLTRKYYLFGRDRVIRRLDLKPGEKLVEIGCGTARNLVAIARRYPGVRLYGLDASAEMLRTAHESAGKTTGEGQAKAEIRLVQAYAEELNEETFGPGSAPFDRALFSYSLSMIPDWRAALDAAANVVRPGGCIDVVDFGDLAGLGVVLGGLLRGWLRLFHVEPRAEILRSVEPFAAHLADFWISSGRYAFSFRCRPEELVCLRLGHVAEESQTLRKP